MVVIMQIGCTLCGIIVYAVNENPNVADRFSIWVVVSDIASMCSVLVSRNSHSSMGLGYSAYFCMGGGSSCKKSLAISLDKTAEGRVQTRAYSLISYLYFDR